MTTNTSNSKQVTLSANTAYTQDWAEWFEYIVITNLGTTAVWVCTDGSTAQASVATEDVVLPGATAVFSNRQAKPPWAYVGAGGLAAPGATVQQSQNGTNLPPSSFGTFVSLITTGTGVQVVASPQ